MREHYNRVFFIDTENQGAMYLKDLNGLTNKDLVICMFTEYSPKFTYDQVGKFLESSASFKFIDCLAGTPNSLDFQLSSMLGYYLRMEDEEKEETNPTDFIILSQDTGYYGIIQFWSNQGYNVHIRNSLLGENIDVRKALENLTANKAHLAMEVAANKAKLSGTENRATKKLELEQQQKVKLVSVKTNVKDTKSALEKFNSRLEKTKEIQSSKKETKTENVTESIEKVEKKTISLAEGLKKDSELEISIEGLDVNTNSQTVDEECLSTNKNFSVLSTSSVGVAYKNIQTLELSLNVTDKLDFNSNKVGSFIKTSNIVSYVIGYILYYSKNKNEMKVMLEKYLSLDEIDVLMKRYAQKHFKNHYGLII